MNRFRILKYRCPRRVIATGILVLAWLALVYALPREAGNLLAVIGLLIGSLAYMDWGDDPKEYPNWGCFLHFPLRPMEIHLPPEAEAKLAEIRERQTLLRASAAEECSESKQPG